MEEDIPDEHSRDIFKITTRINERLKKAIDTASNKQKYAAAHDLEMIKALDVVRHFIKKMGRVCYGGTAMNMILPPKKRFYDSELDLPDYDFFTPDMEGDIHILVEDLHKAGFKEVYHRMGIHEGTKKILVNYTPIADISEISESVYKVFHRRAIKKEGLHYTDPDVLRMMMYLELSRPKGQLDRWEKVYERLQIINAIFNPKTEFINKGKTRSSGNGDKNRTRKTRGDSQDHSIPDDIRNYIFSFCIEFQKVILSGNMAGFYNSVINTKTKTLYNVTMHTGVVSFFSSDIKADSKFLQTHLGGPTKCKYTLHEKKGDILPEYSVITHLNKPIAIIFNEHACSSYYNFTTPDGSVVMIASLDTLITMYYSIYLFSNKARSLMPSIDIQIPKCIELTEKNRRLAKSQITPFSLICKGHQKALSSLMREKVERIRREKGSVIEEAHR